MLRKSTVMMLFPSSRRARDRGGALKSHVSAATVCATKPVIFICFEKKPAAFVWPRRSNMVLPRTLTVDLDEELSSLCSLTPQGHLWGSRFWGASDVYILAHHPHYCYHLLHFTQCSGRWHLLRSCCLGMWRLFGKHSISIWRFRKGVCPSSFVFVSF